MKFWSNDDKVKIYNKLEEYFCGDIFIDEMFPYLGELDKFADDEITLKNSSKGFHMHIKHSGSVQPKNSLFISVDLLKSSPRMNLYMGREQKPYLTPFDKGIFGRVQFKDDHLTDTWKEWIKESYITRKR